jgi:DNA-binding MarR family transcriptional regulator
MEQRQAEELSTAARALRQSVTRLARRLRSQRQAHGVSPAGVSVLARLYRDGTATPRYLAEAEHLAPQSLTRILAALEERRLIERRSDPADGRQALLTLTAAGRVVLREDSERRERWLAAAMADELTPAEQRMVRAAAELLDRLADH